MNRYYNTTRGSLVLNLKDGSSVSLSPRTTFECTPALDGSADILAKLRKGMLKKLAPVATPKVEVEVVPEVVPTPELFIPQTLVDESDEEVADTPSLQVELGALSTESDDTDILPKEDTPSEEEPRSKNRRFGKHRS